MHLRLLFKQSLHAGCYKLNVCAVMSSHQGVVGLRFVIPNNLGEAIDIGIARVVVESYSLQAVKLINGDFFLMLDRNITKEIKHLVYFISLFLIVILHKEQILLLIIYIRLVLKFQIM